MKTKVLDKLDWVVVPPPQTPYQILKSRWDEQGWEIRDWGNGSMKTLPFSTENYDYEEYDPSKVTIPQEGLPRLLVAKELVPVRRVVIAHERNPVIDAPPEPEIWQPELPKIPRPDWGKITRKIKEWDLGRLKWVAIGLGVVVFVALAIAAMPVVVVGAAATGVAFDPCVICELEDGTWAEVYYFFPQDSSED
jgi:hypothetical protein